MASSSFDSESLKPSLFARIIALVLPPRPPPGTSIKFRPRRRSVSSSSSSSLAPASSWHVDETQRRRWWQSRRDVEHGTDEDGDGDSESEAATLFDEMMTGTRWKGGGAVDGSCGADCSIGDEDEGHDLRRCHERDRRRAKALQVCGILGQSRRYRSVQLESTSLRRVAPSRIQAREMPEGEQLEREREPSDRSETRSSNPSSAHLQPPSSPSTASRRIRRRASIAEEVANIGDEEARRLAEIAYLS